MISSNQIGLNPIYCHVRPRDEDSPNQVKSVAVMTAIGGSLGIGITSALGFELMPLVWWVISVLALAATLLAPAILASTFVMSIMRDGTLDLLRLTSLTQRDIIRGYAGVVARRLRNWLAPSLGLIVAWPLFTLNAMSAQYPLICQYDTVGSVMTLMCILLAGGVWFLHRPIITWSVALSIRWKQALPAVVVSSAVGLLPLAILSILLVFEVPRHLDCSFICTL